MEELLSFEVRPVQGVVVAVGEEVTFKEEDGKLLALNEGGEAFGVVPNKFSKKLLELTAAGEVISASVEGRSDGVPLIVVSREDETVEEDLDKELISVETTEKPSSEEDASQVAEAEETVQVSSTPIPPEEADK